jgi:hypothetical protein
LKLTGSAAVATPQAAASAARETKTPAVRLRTAWRREIGEWVILKLNGFMKLVSLIAVAVARSASCCSTLGKPPSRIPQFRCEFRLRFCGEKKRQL